MSFLYVNPGYAELLDSTDYTTVKDNFTYSPLTGVSFTKTNPAATPNEINIPNTTVCIKFNWWHGGASNGIFKFSTPGTTSFSNSVGSFTHATTVNGTVTNSALILNYTYCIETATNKKTANYSLPYDVNPMAVNSFHLYLLGSRPTVTINGTTIMNNSNVFLGSPKFNMANMKVTFEPGTYSGTIVDNVKTFFSDLILSDEYIPPDAQVAILPASNIETNMESVEGGLYTPKSGDPTWLMTPNITPLLESHLSSSKVYALAVGANPCEVLGGGNATFTTLSKSEGTLTEHGTVTVTSADSAFCDGWITENTTLGDLANMQLGLKSGG